MYQKTEGDKKPSVFLIRKMEVVMSDKEKRRISFVEAVITTLWVKGLITPKERDEIQQNSREKLQKSNC